MAIVERELNPDALGRRKLRKRRAHAAGTSGAVRGHRAKHLILDLRTVVFRPAPNPVKAFEGMAPGEKQQPSAHRLLGRHGPQRIAPRLREHEFDDALSRLAVARQLSRQCVNGTRIPIIQDREGRFVSVGNGGEDGAIVAAVRSGGGTRSL